jgi:hypothetical protein
MERVTYADMDREMGVFGDPEYCIARVRELQAEYGFDEFICYFNQGGLMDPALVKESMTLFAREVMPDTPEELIEGPPHRPRAGSQAMGGSADWKYSDCVDGARNSGSHETPRWRGMDSKIQFRDASPRHLAWAASFDCEWWLLGCRNSSIGCRGRGLLG